MAIINTSKPTSSISNSSRVVSYETWDSNTTTWNTEVRTWDEMAAIMDNTSKPTTSIINTNKP